MPALSRYLGNLLAQLISLGCKQRRERANVRLCERRTHNASVRGMFFRPCEDDTASHNELDELLPEFRKVRKKVEMRNCFSRSHDSVNAPLFTCYVRGGSGD